MTYVAKGIVMAQMLLFSLAASGVGQSPDVMLGAHVGLSLATFRGQGVEGLKTRSGLTAGLSIERRIHRLGWIATGASWIRKGATGTLTGFEEALLTDLRLDYVQIPLLLGVRAPAEGDIRSVVFAGPALAFEVSCDRLTHPAEIALTLGCPEQGTRRRTDWSGIVGAGVEYGVTRATVRLVARYDHGFTQLNDVRDGAFARLHNRAFAVGVTFLVPLGEPAGARGRG